MRKSLISLCILVILVLFSSEVSYAVTWTTLTPNPSLYTSGSVSSGSYQYFMFTKSANYRYLVCINTTSGDADLYGHYLDSVSKTNSQFYSDNSALEDDYITFDAGYDGNYYLAIYGFSSSNFRIYVLRVPKSYVPWYLTNQLACPFDSSSYSQSPYSGNYTSSDFGPFLSPWGNAEYADFPFYSGKQNYYHSGVDYQAPVNTPIYAAYSGVVKKVGYLGTGWGYYVVIEHSISGNTFTTVYDHLNYAGRPVEQTIVSKYQQIGTLYNINVNGEVPHLHFAIHTGSPRTSTPTGQSGAMLYSYWRIYYNVFINPDVNDNPGLYSDY